MNTAKLPPSIVDEIDAWLTHLRAQGRSSRTLETYRTALTHLGRALSRNKVAEIHDILPDHLHRWRKELIKFGCRPPTVDLFTRVARCWFAWLASTDRLFFSPANDLERTRLGRTLGRCPTPEQMRRLLDGVRGEGVIEVRDRAVLELAYSTGARSEEIEKLNLESLDLDRRTALILGKGGRQRVVPLTRAAVFALIAYLTMSRPTLLRGHTDQPALFLGQRSGRRLATFAVAGIVRRRGAAIGLVISPHDIRRAMATHLLKEGASLAHVKQLLGHADFSHLKAYLCLAPTDVQTMHRKSALNR